MQERHAGGETVGVPGGLPGELHIINVTSVAVVPPLRHDYATPPPCSAPNRSTITERKAFIMGLILLIVIILLLFGGGGYYGYRSGYYGGRHYGGGLGLVLLIIILLLLFGGGGYWHY